MKTKVLTSSILMALTLVGFNAYADNSDGLSREQVRAELAQAKAQGQVFNDATYPGAFPATGKVTREQVLAELAQAKAEGKVFDDATYPGPFPATGNVTREQVRAELAQAKAEGWTLNDATYPEAELRLAEHHSADNAVRHASAR